MNTRKTSIFLIIIAIFLNTQNTMASDLAKEKRWAEQITDSIMTGEAQSLTAKKVKFLSIYTPAETNKVLGGVILAHGLGVHPNWNDVILPLRSELPNFGWATLSIQMPILANDAPLKDYLPLFDEVPARLDAAVQFFNSKNITNIVIVAHSLGSVMSVYYLSQNAKTPIQALVAIGMSSQDFNDKLNVVKSLGKLKLPILDLYGSRDLELVIKSAASRARAAKRAGNKNYTQTEVIGADHFFAQQDETLILKVRSWLAKYAPGVAIIKKEK
ncbi:hypothetical protein MNBD_GAMMA22-3037 [hydrothermal vent metagenome]|uniref:DUF3530 family protein n=1 Tax=hydrothermal vent metagenome TaxID=652676 RepID=A0A3B1ABJ3_9ZZZZ